MRRPVRPPTHPCAKGTQGQLAQSAARAAGEHADNGEAMVEQLQYIAVATFLVWGLVSSLAHTPRR
ncbi:MAG: hypothetical protein K2X52_08485 [Mycobacteriaceae bacterium]|nr:hypothetical protein [Mycobacteriaceae bacterium]